MNEKQNEKQNEKEFTGEALSNLMMDIYADMDIDECIREYEELEAQGKLPEISEEETRRVFKRAIRSVRRKRIQKAIKTITFVASLVLMLMCVATILIMSVDAWRTSIRKFIVERFDRYSIISLDKSSDVTETHESIVEALSEVIPQEYVLRYESVMQNGSFFLLYENGNGDCIELTIASSHWDTFQDTERSEAKTVWVDDNEAFWVEKDGRNLIWVDKDEGLLYRLYASALSDEVFWNVVDIISK